MDDEQRELLDEEDLDKQDGELLPEREQMSVIDLGEGGGLAPPPMDDPGMVETPPITPEQPPTE
jgi:hypothetical protein